MWYTPASSLTDLSQMSLETTMISRLWSLAPSASDTGAFPQPPKLFPPYLSSHAILALHPHIEANVLDFSEVLC